jgi:hypothetical protein
MRMIAIHAQTERKRLDRSVRCAEKRRPWARKQRLRGLIRPDPAVCATAGAACGRKSLSSARIQAIFTSNDTPLGECRSKWDLEVMEEEYCSSIAGSSPSRRRHSSKFDDTHSDRRMEQSALILAHILPAFRESKHRNAFALAACCRQNERPAKEAVPCGF